MKRLETVSVVIPARNEAKAIGAVVGGILLHVPEPREVVVVDDGSDDGTADEAAGAGARVIRRRRAGGKGVAVRDALAVATGDVVLLIDGDGQDDPADAPRILAAMRPGVAMAIGSRFLGTIAEGGITRVNRAANLSLTALFNVLYGTALTDTQAGFRAVRRAAVPLDRLRASAYELETELTALAVRAGGRIVEVPVGRYARNGGETSFVRPYHGTRILFSMAAGALSWRLARIAATGGPT